MWEESQVGLVGNLKKGQWGSWALPLWRTPWKQPSSLTAIFPLLAAVILGFPALTVSADIKGDFYVCSLCPVGIRMSFLLCWRHNWCAADEGVGGAGSQRWLWDRSGVCLLACSHCTHLQLGDNSKSVFARFVAALCIGKEFEEGKQLFKRWNFWISFAPSLMQK